MAEQTDIAFQLGEITGQLREIIHGMNNTNMKIDAIALRVGALEVEKNQREGASKIVTTILKSPTIGWLVGAVVSAWAILTGKVHV